MAEQNWSCPSCGLVEQGLQDSAGRHRCPNDGCDKVLQWVRVTPRIRRGPPMKKTEQQRKAGMKAGIERSINYAREQAKGKASAARGKLIMSRVVERERRMRGEA